MRWGGGVLLARLIHTVEMLATCGASVGGSHEGGVALCPPWQRKGQHPHHGIGTRCRRGRTHGIDAGSSCGAGMGSSCDASASNPHDVGVSSPHGASTNNLCGADVGIPRGAEAGNPHGADAGIPHGADVGSSHGADTSSPRSGGASLCAAGHTVLTKLATWWGHCPLHDRAAWSQRGRLARWGRCPCTIDIVHPGCAMGVMLPTCSSNPVGATPCAT